MTSIGEPVALQPLIRCGEGEPVSDPGSSAGSPTDSDYDGHRDFDESLKVGYAAIRERMANGGPGWEPKR
jgi:hypothetical protein